MRLAKFLLIYWNWQKRGNTFFVTKIGKNDIGENEVGKNEVSKHVFFMQKLAKMRLAKMRLAKIPYSFTEIGKMRLANTFLVAKIGKNPYSFTEAKRQIK